MTDSFLSRWSKRKAEVQSAIKPEETATKNQEVAPNISEAEVSNPSSQVTQSAKLSEAPETFKGPTMDDVKNLTKESDFSAFVAKDVDPNVQNAAMKTLFSDPHFNVMDGLDIYIDDYSKPDPLPPGMLEKMVQSSMLGLFKSKLEEGSSDEVKAQASGVVEDRSVQEVQEIKALESDTQNQLKNSTPISETNLDNQLENKSVKKSES
jgi:hypothetical protein